MRITKKPDLEPIPGYRLIAPLGAGGFGEVWKCEAPGGLVKAIKFVPTSSNSLLDGPCRSSEELRAIQRIKDLRHPFLLSMERVEIVDGDLIIVMELADRSLHDLLREHQAAGQPGLPRADVLRYLAEAAEVLDLMHLEYGLQHLDIKPRNLFLIRAHVKVADFGLVQSFGDAEPTATGELGKSAKDGMHLSAVTPLYAAPELFRSAISPHCDQYSLAIVFHELLTGELPFNGKNVRQLMFQHTMEKPGLEALPAADRAAVARALSKDPAQRFRSCTEFVRALASAGVSATALPRPRHARSSGPGRSGGSGQAGAETRTNLSVANTVSLSPANARALPDYQFLSRLSRDPLGETWEAQTAEGKRRLVKFLYVPRGGARPQDEAILHLQALHHPALLPLTITQGGPGCLVVVSDLVGTSLRQRFQEWQARGERGIPRAELLGHLHSAAEALDQLYQQHGLQHLDLNPSRLLLTGTLSDDDPATTPLPSRRVLLGDFGLAQLLWVPTQTPIGQAQMRYSAPELAQHLITRSCDQYSLAVIYQELLTGHHPFRGRVSS
ncbi:MAG TPA: protein kinase, partial [Gemmataceae bacterium]|nr:protein kinase [Gemmataceae bacterium]